MAGDEAQTVRPTDFEWAWLNDLLHDQAGSPAEHKLTANLRSGHSGSWKHGTQQARRLANSVTLRFPTTWRRVIGTATTDVNGNFTFTFLWCCFRWLPWLEPVWTVDPEPDRRITQLLASANINLPPTPGAGPDPAFFESILAGASRTSARQLAATQTVESAATISAESVMTELPGAKYDVRFAISPWPPRPNVESFQLGRPRQNLHERDAVRRVVEFPLSTGSGTSDAKQKKDAGRAAAAVAQRVDLGAIVVDAAVYNCWIICCRRHTILGASIPRAQVRLSLKGRAPDQEALSADGGDFSFQDIAPGPYQLSFR